MKKFLACLAVSISAGLSAAVAQAAKSSPGIEHLAYVLCDDHGWVFLNGKAVLETSKVAPYKLPIVLRKGDVLGVVVADKQKGKAGQFAIQILLDNKVVAIAKDFSYSVAPDPDWKTTTDFFGWRRPAMRTMKTPLGNEASPQSGWAQPQDEKYERVYFKYIIP